MKIYTKLGDTGKTSLLNGRVSKSNLRIETNGQIDELLVLLARLIKEVKEDNNQDLKIVYKRLFIISSMIADVNSEYDYHIKDEDIKFLEDEIDKMTEVLPMLTSFIYYTGSNVSMLAHEVRAKVRSVERTVTRVDEVEEINPMILKYLNRLSDYFFTLARYLNNKDGNEEDSLIL